MNWPLVIAGSLALLGSAIHGIVGDRIVRRIDENSLPSNRFSGISTKFLIRVTWHFVTIAFLVLGVALVLVGTQPGVTAATGVAYVSGGAFMCWSLLGFIGGVRHAGIGVLKTHPAPVIFLITVVLISWGASRL